MRDGPTDEVLAGTCSWNCRIASWLGGTLLADDIPILGGNVSGDATQDVPEKLTMTVPRYASPADGEDVFDWRPGETDYTHPLARYGQQLDVTIIVGSVATAEVWEVPIGRYRISDWSDDDAGTITVTAEGLLSLPRDDLFTSPTSPYPGATLVSEARRIAPGGMSVSYAPSLVDRACPASMAWSDSKLAALQEIATAWPALLRSDSYGGIVFAAPLPAVPTPVIFLTDGEGGTIVHAPRSDTRKNAFNRVIASSSNSGSADVSAVADVTAGPMSVDGDYGVVAMKWSSPLIDSVDTAAAAAATTLQNNMRPALSIPVEMAPDPRIELDDAVQVTRDGEFSWGYVISYQIPLAAGDGMQLSVGVTS